MSTINSRLIDEYNWGLKPISYLSDINSDYVVLINTNTDGTAGTNKKIKIGLLKNYILLSYTESDVQDSVYDKSIQGQINNLNDSVKNLQEHAGDLETRVNTIEHLITLA